MTDLVPLQSRHAPAPNGTVMPAPAAPLANLGEVERWCNMIASGGEIVPPAYRAKPGAVLLAKLWGDANGVDVFTAMQNISIVEGRTFVSAEMRVAMGTARGFEFRVTESTREVCTVEVWRGADLRGSITARYDDMPRKLQYKSGAATPWKLHPDDMLFAEACRKADRRYVKTAAALLDAGQDYTVQRDALDVLAAPAPAPDTAGDDDWLAPDGLPHQPEFDIDPEPPASTAPVDATIADVTVAELVAAARASGRIPATAGDGPARKALLTVARELVGVNATDPAELVADQAVAEELLAKLTTAAG